MKQSTRRDSGAAGAPEPQTPDQPVRSRTYSGIDDEWNEGSPSPVPDTPPTPDGQNISQLGHGAHGAQGGEAGNEYQAMWMMLAYHNALCGIRSGEQPLLKEIILEGKREPFDDVEIVRPDGSLTLFQSKHRELKGSDNISLSMLLASPVKQTASEKSRSSTPFSLLKYFKGWAKIKADNPRKAIRFILCVSAPFGLGSFIPKNERTAFKGFFNGAASGYTEKTGYFKLSANTWRAGGVLENIPQELHEPLLMSVFHQRGHQVDHRSVGGAQYLKFGRNFIQDDAGLCPEHLALKRYIFLKLSEFIAAARMAKEPWVNWDQTQDNAKIQEFLNELQFWLKQPKLSQLAELVKKAIHINFEIGSGDIHSAVLACVKRSSDRQALPVTLAEVEGFYRSARGAILVKYLRVKMDEYKEEFALNYFQTLADSELPLKTTVIDDFLNADDKRILLLYSNNPSEIKFYLYAFIKNITKERSIVEGEHWLMVKGKKSQFFTKTQ
ncbi:MAG: hypothetical protein KAT71_05745 [Gammaproteobacteria bacterium]|nr:hypothetical protein [Gammaproteobacteria bacterium]